MSVPATDGSHEFIITPELAEVAERLGVLLARRRPGPVRGHRRRGEGSDAPRRRRLSWLGSVSTGEHTLSERAKDDIRTGMGQQTD